MKKWENLLKIIVGNMILAFSVNMFILPFEFIAYGTTGLGLIANHFLLFIGRILVFVRADSQTFFYIAYKIPNNR